MAVSDDNKTRPKGVLRWIFEDRTTGRIVVGQWPNIPLWIFLAAFLLDSVFHPGGRFGTLLEIVKVASLTVWAMDEIIRGVNPWRRAIGAAVILVEVIGWLRWVTGH